MNRYAQVSEQWNHRLKCISISIRTVRRIDLPGGGELLVPIEEIIMRCPLDKAYQKM